MTTICFKKKIKKPIDKPIQMWYNITVVERQLQTNKGAFPSGQRGQTVNLLLLASVVRIHPLPPPGVNPWTRYTRIL